MNLQFKIEKEHLALFLELSNQAGWKVNRPISDPPDLIIIKGDKSVAIEHTRLYINDTKAQETEWQNLMRACQKDLIRKGITDCIVRLEPDNNVKIIKSRRAELNSLLISLIISQKNVIGNDKITIARNPAPEILSVKAFKRPGPLRITFDSRRWGSSVVRTSQLLIAKVQSKSEKINKIDLNMYDQIWLLLVLEGKPFSDSPKLDNLNILPCHLNSFDKVYLLHVEDRWYQVINNSA